MTITTNNEKHCIARRLTLVLNSLGPYIGSYPHESTNPLAELMAFYWQPLADQSEYIHPIISGSYQSRASFVALADFLYLEGKDQ